MTTSVRRDWAAWLHQRLQHLSVVAGGVTPRIALNLSSPHPLTPNDKLSPVIDLIGLGDLSSTPPIGSIEPPGTAISLLQLQHVIRPSDLAVVGISFLNLQLVYAPAGSPTPSRLVVLDPLRPCHIQVRLPAQSIGEDTFSEFSSELPIPTRARAAGASNLLFRLPDPVTPIPFSFHGILNALRHAQLETRDELTIPFSAANVADQFGLSPTDFNLFSWLELPYRVILAPSPSTHWNTSSLSVQTEPGATTRAELWHARFGKATGNSAHPANEDIPLEARAVWTPDLNANAPPIVGAALKTSLSADDRRQLVRLSSDKNLVSPTGKVTTPPRIALERLTVSALGAWLTAQWTYPGASDIESSLPEGFSLSEWAHRTTLGRDQFVRLVHEGFLYPFGHRAALVEITERKLKPVSAGASDVVGTTAASLRTRQFIIIRQPDRDYTQRALPFRRLHLKTRVAPDFEVTDAKSFWVQVPAPTDTGVADFRFAFVGTDWQQNLVEFTAPAIFVSTDVTIDASIATDYNTSIGTDGAPRRQTNLAGQRLAYAPGTDQNDLRTTLPSDSFNFAATNDTTIQPAFRPDMQQANVFIPAIEALKGERVSTSIALHERFTSASSGMGNPADVFAQVLDGAPPNLSVSKEQAGGMIAPSYSIQGLSREFGPVSDLANLVGASAGSMGRFEIGNYLPDITLLGGITLQTILNALDFVGVDSLKFGDSTPGAMMPGLTTSREGNTIVTRFTWRVSQGKPTDSGSPFISSEIFTPDTNAEFKIATTITQPLDGSAPLVEAIGSLSNFTINLVPGFQAVAIRFNSVSFTSRTGSKVDVAVVLNEYTFINELAFVQELMRFVPLDGFSDPPYLELADGGLNVGFTFGIPTVGMGMFTMQDLSLSAGFYLPIIADEPTSLKLAFNKREAPCVITVSGFGGGAFFAIALSLNGLQALEAALEFGAAVAISLGVASGAVTVMGGVYFSMKKDTNTQGEVNVVAFTAYIRIVGELDVLGLISISVEFYLGMTYNPAPKLLEGEARLTVKVKIAFFSKKVGISVHRELKGSDPKFVELVTPTDWNTYLAAFAGV